MRHRRRLSPRSTQTEVLRDITRFPRHRAPPRRTRLSYPDHRRRVLRHRSRHRTRQGRFGRLPDRRGRRGTGRHLVLEHLPRHRRRHPVVLLPVLVRAECRLVSHLCTRQGTQGLRRPLRRQIRAAPKSPFNPKVTGAVVVEYTASWLLDRGDRETLTATVLINASGVLTVP